MPGGFLHKFINGKRGSVLVLVAVSLVALFAFAALSVDVATVLYQQRSTNHGTDAAALAAAAKLTDPSANSSAVQQEGMDIAQANGVTASEIAAGAFSGYPGQVQLGRWTNGVFVAEATPYNAVRVPARRSVSLNFARAFGMRSMNPAAHSVAALTSAGLMANPVPFGVTQSQLASNCLDHGNCFGYFMVLNDDAVGSGKQGKVNLGNYQNTGEWQAAMTENGCNCQVFVGPISTISGNAQVKQSFQALGVGSVFAMPVVDDAAFSGNSGQATIVGFIIVQMTSFSGTGNKWSATVMFLDRVTGGGPGGNCPPPCSQVRALVE